MLRLRQQCLAEAVCKVPLARHSEKAGGFETDRCFVFRGTLIIDTIQADRCNVPAETAMGYGPAETAMVSISRFRCRLCVGRLLGPCWRYIVASCSDFRFVRLQQPCLVSCYQFVATATCTLEGPAETTHTTHGPAETALASIVCRPHVGAAGLLSHPDDCLGPPREQPSRILDHRLQQPDHPVLVFIWPFI